MDYDADMDVYTCKNGKQLHVAGTRTSRSASGYRSTVTIYRCDDCMGCPYKEKCIIRSSQGGREHTSFP